MHWYTVLIYAVVGCIGLPAALRNMTAAALVVSWMIGEITWMVTGERFPFRLFFMADIAVIAVIYAKTIVRCGPKQYPTLGAQLRCLITDPTPCDRLVLAIFMLGQWPLYIVSLHPYYRWWALFWLVIAQFLLAGGEALGSYLKVRREARNPTPIIDRHLVVIPFPVKCREADAVRNIPEPSGALLTANRGGGYG